MEIDTEIENIENVRVVIRIRPFNENEKDEIEKNLIIIDELENTICVNDPKEITNKLQTKTFTFDYIFSQTATQFNVYQKVVLPIVETIFEGYNGTILAYGQTGSGKTYTMSGNQDQNSTKGIIPNTLSHIFNKILKASYAKSFAVFVTYLEIYNEEVRDLLSNSPNEKRELRETLDLGVSVEGVAGFRVRSIEATNKLLNLGDNNRATRTTTMNELSSRSHAIFTIEIETKDIRNDKITLAKLNLVDLAGSERISERFNNSGDGFKETTNINQSLFALSNVITALIEDDKSYIPYRNSKLTRLLQNSLGGNSKTVMIATISPISYDCTETLCTLRYASRTKLIQNRVRLNVQHNRGLIQYLEKQIFELRTQLSGISTNTIQMEEQLKSKKNKKGKTTLEEVIYIKKVKANLQRRVLKFQSNSLNGNESLFEKEQQLVNLLKKSLNEQNYLDETNQALNKRLEEVTIENQNLRQQNVSLSERSLEYDFRIKKMEQTISDLETIKFCDIQDQTDNLCKDKRNKEHLQQSFSFVKYLMKHTIPPRYLQTIESYCYWDSNEDVLDYKVRGLDSAQKKINQMNANQNMSKLQKRLVDPVPQTTNIYKSYPTYKQHKQIVKSSGTEILLE